MRSLSKYIIGALMLLFVSCATKVKDKQTIINSLENTINKNKEEYNNTNDTIKITETKYLPSESILEYVNICKEDSISKRLNLPNGFVDIFFKNGNLSIVNYYSGGSKTETNTSHNEQNSLIDSTKEDNKEFVYIDKEVVKKVPYLPSWVFISIGLNILFIGGLMLSIKKKGIKGLISLIIKK